MAKLDEIQSKFTDEDNKTHVNMEEMPEQLGSFSPAPYPGHYTFQLPPELNFEPVKRKVTINVAGDKAELQRIQVLFDDQHPLTIVEAGPTNLDFIGERINFRTSNAEYLAGRKDDKKLASDLGFLLRDGFRHVLPAGASNIDYGRAINEHVNGRFRGDVEWDAHCDPERNVYVVNEETEEVTKDENTVGCGARYAQRQYVKGDGTKVTLIPKEAEELPDGTAVEKFQETFICRCGALIRCFPRIRNYGFYETEEAAAGEEAAS